MVNHQAPSGTPSLGEVLNSPEMQALREAWQQHDAILGAEDQAWWDSLTMEERARAVRQIAKLMYKSEVKEKGSYRSAMYDTFGIDYSDGLNHYMALHNLIHRGLDAEALLCNYEKDEDGLNEKAGSTNDQ